MIAPRVTVQSSASRLARRTDQPGAAPASGRLTRPAASPSTARTEQLSASQPPAQQDANSSTARNELSASQRSAQQGASPGTGTVDAIRAAASRAAAQLRALFADEPDDDAVYASRTAARAAPVSRIQPVPSPPAPDSRIQPVSPRGLELIARPADRRAEPADPLAIRTGGPEGAPAADAGTEPQPGVRITIGQITVQAPAPDPAPAPAPTASPIVSLADYLQRREEMWG